MSIENRYKQLNIPFTEHIESVRFVNDKPELPGFDDGPRNLILKLSETLIGPPSRYCFKDHTDIIDPSNGLCCSEFVLHVLKETQKSFPDLLIPNVRYANEMWDNLGISISSKYARPGDLIFYSHYGSVPKHVGIFFGITVTGSRYMIDSEGEAGGHIVLSQISDNYRYKKYVDDPLYENGLLGYKRLTIKTSNSRWPQLPIK